MLDLHGSELSQNLARNVKRGNQPLTRKDIGVSRFRNKSNETVVDLST
jgi:hypothetical protein